MNHLEEILHIYAEYLELNAAYIQKIFYFMAHFSSEVPQSSIENTVVLFRNHHGNLKKSSALPQKANENTAFFRWMENLKTSLAF